MPDKKNSDVKPGIMKGAGVNLIGELSSKIIVLLTTIVVSRLFSNSDAGLFFLGYSFVEVASFISMMGMRIGIVRFVAMYSETDWNKVRDVLITGILSVLAVSSIIAVILATNLEFLVVTILKKESFLLIASWFVVALPFEALRKTLLGGLEGLKIMKYTMLIEGLLLQTCRLVLIFGSVFLGYGIEGAAAGFFVSSALCCGAAILVVNNYINIFSIKKIKTDYVKLLKYSFPMFPASLLFNTSRQFGIIMLGFLGTEASIALFSVCIRLCNSAEVLARAFQQILNPNFAIKSSYKNPEELKDLFRFSFRWICLGTVPIFLSIMLFYNFFLGIFFEDINAAIVCLELLAVTHMISSVTNLNSSLIIMAGHSNLSLLNNALFFSVYLAASYFAIPKYGLNGAAASHMVSFLFLASLRTIEVSRIFGIKKYNKYFFKSLIISFLCATPYLLVLSYFKIDDVKWVGVHLVLFAISLSIAMWHKYLTEAEKKIIKSFFLRHRISI